MPDGPGAGSAQKARQDAELDGSFVSPKDGDTSNKDGGCLVGPLTVKITANPLDDQKMLVTCFGLKFHSFGVWGFGGGSTSYSENHVVKPLINMPGWNIKDKTSGNHKCITKLQCKPTRTSR